MMSTAAEFLFWRSQSSHPTPLDGLSGTPVPESCQHSEGLAVIVSRNFLPLPMRSSRIFVIDLEAIHSDVAFAGLGGHE